MRVAAALEIDVRVVGKHAFVVHHRPFAQHDETHEQGDGHEQEGQQVHGDTLVVKVGAAESRRAARIVIGNDISAEFFTF